MERISLEVPLGIAYEPAKLEDYIRTQGYASASDQIRLLKRSLDARGRTIKVLLQAEIGATLPSEYVDVYQHVATAPSVAIIGAGPAGLFAALRLLELGLRPVVFERGANVRARRRDLAAINKQHIVNPESNYCFGEGGAGTYSDGKLYTRSGKRGSIRRILNILVRHGANPDILIDAHPHIGTNKLPLLVSAISDTIRAHGGEIHYNTRIVDFGQAGTGQFVETASGQMHHVAAIVLATGHSARDMFELLHAKGLDIEAKPFAIGVRVEHPQQFINERQYRPEVASLLPPASYTLSHQANVGNRRMGVFSFCMCPGGFIVPAATAPGQIVVNGMSPSRRDSRYANSGIVAEVDANIYGTGSPLAGMHYQAEVEAVFSQSVGGTQAAPAQLLSDFVHKRQSTNLYDTSYQPGLHSARVDALLPNAISTALRQAFSVFDKRLRGYIHPQSQVIGLESRTSSPVTLPRDTASLQHPQWPGFFPCGEGAGYAGGILSAAMDGERVAEAVVNFVNGGQDAILPDNTAT